MDVRRSKFESEQNTFLRKTGCNLCERSFILHSVFSQYREANTELKEILGRRKINRINSLPEEVSECLLQTNTVKKVETHHNMIKIQWGKLYGISRNVKYGDLEDKVLRKILS